MGWASGYIGRLKQGETVEFRPRGNSMTPHIKSGQLVAVVPATVETVEVGAVVLCIVAGKEFLHFVRAHDGRRVQIGNAHGHINGWTKQVFGCVVKIE